MKEFDASGKCPTCGYVFEKCSNLTGSGAPHSGDLTLCIECGEILRFERINGALQIFKSDHRSPEILRLQRLIRSDEVYRMKAHLRSRN